jgi:hypothetical protein
MSMPIIKSYEIKTSKTQCKIPVVNGVHLHSVYNPIKEALSLVSKNDDTLRTKSEVLILGLGFGYHVHEIARCLKEYHGDKYRLVVIEPNQQVVDDYRKETKDSISNLKIFSSSEISDLYSRSELVSFLIGKPGVIAHPASFNLYNNYFKAFLTFKAPGQTKDICQHIHNNSLKEYIQSFSNSENLDSLIDQQVLDPGKLKDKYAFALGAFRELTREKATGEQPHE